MTFGSKTTNLTARLWVSIVSARIFVSAVKTCVGFRHSDRQRLHRLHLIRPLLKEDRTHGFRRIIRLWFIGWLWWGIIFIIRRRICTWWWCTVKVVLRWIVVIFRRRIVVIFGRRVEVIATVIIIRRRIIGWRCIEVTVLCPWGTFLNVNIFVGVLLLFDRLDLLCLLWLVEQRIIHDSVGIGVGWLLHGIVITSSTLRQLDGVKRWEVWHSIVIIVKWWLEKPNWIKWIGIKYVIGVISLLNISIKTYGIFLVEFYPFWIFGCLWDLTSKYFVLKLVTFKLFSITFPPLFGSTSSLKISLGSAFLSTWKDILFYDVCLRLKLIPSLKHLLQRVLDNTSTRFLSSSCLIMSSKCHWFKLLVLKMANYQALQYSSCILDPLVPIGDIAGWHWSLTLVLSPDVALLRDKTLSLCNISHMTRELFTSQHLSSLTIKLLVFE